VSGNNKNNTMNIEGIKVSTQKSAKEVYAFFTDLSNFKHLMPENIENLKLMGLLLFLD